MAQKGIYFKGLNELRAIAALSVLVHHIEVYKRDIEVPSLYSTMLASLANGLAKGVYMFFVLSGFLITYLLFTEKEKFGKIDLKKFYLRRILRIWPLYYLIVGLSFTVIPLLALHWEPLQRETIYYNAVIELIKSPWQILLLYLLFLPNLALTKAGVVGASQTWSVGVEEQFYLIWPQLLQRVPKKWLLFLFIVIVFCYPYANWPFKIFSPSWGNSVRFITNLLPIHLMAIGAIGAWLLYYKKSQIDKIFKHSALFILNTILLIALLFLNPSKMFFSLVVIVEILFIVREDFKFNLRNKYLSRIGDISYGVYMYHPVVMYIMYAIFNSIIPISKVSYWYQFATVVSITACTLAVSYISYHFFEKRFISYKNRKFTVIASGNNLKP